MKQARVMFAGTSSDVGKTTIVLGVMRALKNRKLRVQGYKAGPDYIDTAFHTFATGMASRNLDTWMMDENTILSLYSKNTSQCDISIMEGVMGMYDGKDVKSLIGSSAHLAKLTKTPVVLIINGGGVAASAAATVLGFKMFDTSVEIKGVIVNKVSGERHYNLIKEAIEYHVGIKCLGYLKKHEEISLKSRHLGLIPSVEVDALEEKIELVAKLIEETVDLDALIDLASTAEIVKDNIVIEKKEKKIRLGLAYDKAFNFYYQDNLDLLESLGCDLIRFSPLKDKALPEGLDGLYIGGGFPEMFGKEIEANITMRNSIKSAVENHMPVYAECGGLMFLTQYIEDLQGKKYNMCGVFENGSKMTKTLQRFGYVKVTLNEDTILGKKGTEFKAHEFHRSVVNDNECVNLESRRKYDISKDRNGEEVIWHCGYKKNNCVGGYPHIHFYNNLQVADNFVASCRKYSNGRKTNG